MLSLLVAGRRMRLVTPLLLCGLLLFGAGALFGEGVFVSAMDVAALRPLLLSVGRMPLYLLAALPIGYACWLLQRWLAAMYASKRFSDAQLAADTWWFVAIFFYAVDVAHEGAWLGLAGMGLFVFYRVVVEVGLAMRPLSDETPPPKRLLVLRTFGAPARAEKLFDQVTERWRAIGSVQLIGATDLALRTIDPGELLSFLGGRFRSQFVAGLGDLERRLADLDVARDPDGRFRVNDFFCFDTTWKDTFDALLTRVDVVLMDLRGLSESNRGCLFELTKLVQRGKLQETLFVLDDATDERIFAETLAAAAAAYPLAPQVTPQLARVGQPSFKQLGAVYAQLLTVGVHT
jgi:hypothetical protein